MKFLLDFFKGMLIGAGAILPGISSGVLCVIFGIYEKLVNSILGLFKNLKENISFLLPIVLGGIFGVILLGNFLTITFERFPIPTKMCFLGFILGTIPSLFQEGNKPKGFRLHFVFYLLLTLGLSLILLTLENSLQITTIDLEPNFIYLVLSGFLMSMGVVIPGVSSTVILMLLGVYDTYLEAVAHLEFSVLIPMGIGLLLGGVIFLKGIQWLLKKHYSCTYYAIIGFVIGSVFILYPGLHLDFNSLISILVCFFSFWIVRKIEKCQKKK